MSKIEWTDRSWNPVTGCTKISTGCKYCYAEVMAKRLQAMRQPRYSEGFALRLQPDKLQEPLGWKKPARIFVNSMSDLYHDDVPVSYIQDVFKTMNQTKQHQYQVLTKRADRMSDLHAEVEWTPNIWAGVSVENSKVAWRIEALCHVPAAVRFLSCEPLLGPLSLRPWLDRLHWVIVGGESGRTPRPMDPEWVRDIRDECVDAGVPFFFKQWGGTNKKEAGRVLDGRTWDELPK